MNTFLTYILESTICICVFYLLFRVLMRKETSFAVSRATLLTIVAASVIVPLVQLPQLMQTPVHVELIPEFSENRIQIQNLPATENTASFEVQQPVGETASATNELTIPLETLLRYFYLAGVLVAFLLFIRNVVLILLLSRKATVQQMDGYRLLIVDREVPSFAFGRSVIISQTDYDTHEQAILAHEQAHIRQNHFVDLLLLELVRILHWFNPAVYALIGDLKEIHEFQADEQTLHSGIDAKQYQLLIIQKGVGPRRFALANSFNHCQIKKRITMMNKSKTSKAWRWKVATFLPLLALLLMAFGNRSETILEMNTLSEKFGVRPSELVNDVKSLTPETVPSSSEKIFIQDNKKRKTEPSVQKKDQPIQVVEKTVNGKVVDSEDKPLEGASVVVSGKTLGTVTDKDGVFNLNLNDTSSIIISFVGFKTVRVSPDFEKSLTVKMVPENVDIDKVVVVAYGTRKKSSSTSKGPNNEGNSNPGKNEVFTIVEKMPEFPGGLLALRKHIAQQIKYPVSAQEAGIQGNVFVSFVINRYGVVSDVKVTKSLHPALDNEAVRVVYTMPKWKPGVQQGKAVDVAYTMPIEFVLEYGSPQQLSSQTSTNSGENSLFTIEIKKDGNYIDNKIWTLEEIGKKAKLSTEKNPNGVASLKVESDVPMSLVSEVKEVLRNSKVLNINYQSVMKSDVSNPSALPPPPPPTVKDLGFRITITNDAFRVNSKELTFEDIEKMINEINPQKQFIQIDSHSTSSKELQSSLKEMLEKKNITYQILWSK